MTRLIDADELRKALYSYYGCVNENSAKNNYNGDSLMSYEVADMIDDCIYNAPTVDAVEVVRCKDCINSRGEEHMLYCTEIDNIGVEDEHYCSWGRKEN